MDSTDLASLLRAEAYDEDTTSVSLLQTHVSYLFLTDHHVYKVKKEVNFGFLDFSTAERRHFFCREELRLNRRLCPGIYLEVRELRRGPHGLNFRGEGELVDHAVKMKRLPAERMMGELVARGMVGEAEVRRLARLVGEFHAAAGTGPDIASFGAPDMVAGIWEETVRQVEPFVGETLAAADLALLREWGGGFLREKRELFFRRMSEGRVRECNGDLHMDNIWLGEEICIFDCIEFNDRFRYLDTASDAAFLLMDFDYRGRRDLGETFLAEYLCVTGDGEAADALPFYKTYRAMVRGKVASLKLHDPQVPAAEIEGAREDAERHFRLARGYVLRERLPRCLIITCGLSGSGKSTLAAELAFELGLEVASSDITRKLLAGGGASGYGQELYTAEHTAATYGALLDRAERALDAGRCIIVDATFRRKSDRAPFLVAAAERRVPVFILAAGCSDSTARQRLDA
ncbi:MAG TPA: AAA family ATPase, partial [Verrucomicrobiae bacterium]|nr:AAA family ATPase [Verrucomicrobiae bacterium]